MIDSPVGSMPPPAQMQQASAANPVQVIQSLESKYGSAFQDIMQQLISVGLIAMPEGGGQMQMPPAEGGMMQSAPQHGLAAGRYK